MIIESFSISRWPTTAGARYLSRGTAESQILCLSMKRAQSSGRVNETERTCFRRRECLFHDRTHHDGPSWSPSPPNTRRESAGTRKIESLVKRAQPPCVEPRQEGGVPARSIDRYFTRGWKSKWALARADTQKSPSASFYGAASRCGTSQPRDPPLFGGEVSSHRDFVVRNSYDAACSLWIRGWLLEFSPMARVNGPVYTVHFSRTKMARTICLIIRLRLHWTIISFTPR